MRLKLPTPLLLVALVVLAAAALHAAELQRATVTRVFNKVEIIPPNSNPAPASIGNTVQGNTGVKTGPQSRAELTFNDQTLARLGANTLFSFDSGTRSVELESGTILLQVPKGIGGAKIKTAPITASITGTTVLLEYSPDGKGTVKLIVLEGTVRLSLNGRHGESIIVRAGQEVSFSDKATRLPEPQDVDLSRIMKTSKLINEGPLGNKAEITNALAAQKILKEKGVLVTVRFDPRRDPARLATQVQNQVQNQRNVIGNPPPAPRPTPVPPPPTPLPPPPKTGPTPGP
ncbi:MAG: FecR family protein [Chthoniobacterales bacterium]